jgi:hypothetical protein
MLGALGRRSLLLSRRGMAALPYVRMPYNSAAVEIKHVEDSAEFATQLM